MPTATIFGRLESKAGLWHTPSLAATALFCAPSAQASTIRPRSVIACPVKRRAARPASSASVKTNSTA